MKITDNVRLNNFDSTLVLPFLSKDKYDLVIDDSEYGIGESSKNHKSRNTAIRQKNGQLLRAKNPEYGKFNWDDKRPDKFYFRNLIKVSKNQIIFGANYFKEFIDNPIKPLRRNEYEDFLNKNPVGWIIWDKMNGDNDFSDCEMIWTSFDKPSMVIYYMWAGMMQGLCVSADFEKSNIQIGNKQLNEKRKHPTQKPVKIYDWILFNYAEYGDRIGDFKGGHCSIGISVHNSDKNLKIDIFEKEKSIYEKAVSRLKNHVSQQKLIL